MQRSFAALRMTTAVTTAMTTALTMTVVLPLQQIHFIHIDRLFVAEEGDQNAKPHRRLSGSIGNDEDRKYLPMQSPRPLNSLPVSREGDQVQVYRIENQLNRHQHDDDIAPGKHANHTEQEQSGAENQIVQRRNIEHCMHINSENLLRLKKEIRVAVLTTHS